MEAEPGLTAGGASGESKAASEGGGGEEAAAAAPAAPADEVVDAKEQDPTLSEAKKKFWATFW